MPETKKRHFRDACGLFATGVTVITTRHEGDVHGMTANAFMSISLDPPLVAISLGEKAKMLSKLRESGSFAVSVLQGEAEDMAWHFAGRPMDDTSNVFCELAGMPAIRDAVAVFSADVEQEIPAGDHSIVIGRVRALRKSAGRAPLLFHGGRFGAPGCEAGECVEEEVMF
ncbi:flavin reductase family protein [Xanthobacter sp. TB0139]|uniref:flavin reductase family protein n=1 Tax=Xanthobacter sp. TB0139 TaxID=3459178 RepID=UPI004039A6A2